MSLKAYPYAMQSERYRIGAQRQCVFCSLDLSVQIFINSVITMVYIYKHFSRRPYEKTGGFGILVSLINIPLQM